MSGSTILGGELRRMQLGSVPGSLYTRPILARVKKSLFDILQKRVAGSAFLDLFAGSGSVGLEAFSRGAKRVIFVDNNPYCQKWIKGNLQTIEQKLPDFFAGKEVRVVRCDILAGLKEAGQSFDLVFAGPPYRKAVNNRVFSRGGGRTQEPNHAARFNYEPLHIVSDLLEIAHRDGALRPKGWFIVQHHSREEILAKASWNCLRQEKYGDTLLSFFEYVG